MDAHDEVSLWISQLRAGDERVPEQIWQAYFSKLTGLARQKLRGLPERVVDAEDIALSALDSFFIAAKDPTRFPKLNDRTDLWKILVVITARKAIHQIRHFTTQKQGGGRNRGDSAFGTEEGAAGLGQVLGREPSPDIVVGFAEYCERLLGLLDQNELRQTAQLKLENFTNVEIAAKMNVTVRSVERYLSRIRQRWASEIGCSDSELSSHS